jgi:hypothetical protein
MVSGGVVMFHDLTQGRNALQSFILLSRVVEQTADSVVLTDTQAHPIRESSLRGHNRIQPGRSSGQDPANTEVGSV